MPQGIRVTPVPRNTADNNQQEGRGIPTGRLLSKQSCANLADGNVICPQMAFLSKELARDEGPQQRNSPQSRAFDFLGQRRY